MRPPRTALVSAAAATLVAGVAGVAVAATAGGAAADVVPSPSLTPPPSVSVLPLPLPTTSAPAPLPTTSAPAPVSTPSLPGSGSGGSGSGGGAGGTGAGSGSGSGGVARGAAPGTGPVAAVGAAQPTARSRAAKRGAAGAKADATPVLAGTDEARDLVDQESSPRMYGASQRFLSADKGIAEIARQKRLLARLRQDAADTVQLYRAMGYDVDGARRVSAAWHTRYDALPADARAAERRLVEDTATRADERLGDLVVAREVVRADFETLAARYREATQAVADASSQLRSLATQRSSALDAVRAAQGGDVALNRERLLESGQLGAQIDALSQQLARRGDVVPGSGRFAVPLDGVITSPFGMRYHPILRYTKLHTGTDFAGGSVIQAADDGRVLMTVVSTAYGNLTVIDHGVIDGKRVTTAYAHQARVLVRPGQVVHKGDPIGIVGQTGYATGPHLHFEVREDGVVVDPVTILADH